MFLSSYMLHSNLNLRILFTHSTFYIFSNISLPFKEYDYSHDCRVLEIKAFSLEWRA